MTTTACTPGWRFFSHFVLRSPGLPFRTLDPLRCTASHAAALAGDGDTARATFTREAAQARAALVELAADPAVQEALFLSSPDFWRNNVGKYLRLAAQGRCNAEMRRIERRLFSYLQRLVAKNETTSAYGPLNYGRMGATQQDAAVHLAYAEGPLVRRRQVFLAFWAVRALARSISADPELAALLPLRLHPMAEIVPGIGLRLHPSGTVVRLPRQLQRALAAADGHRGAASLLAAAGGGDDPAAQATLQQLLDALAAKGALVRAPFVASSCLHLLGPLRDEVAALPPVPARQRWLDRIDAWQQWCDRMAHAPLAERLQLTAEADQRFTAQTGLPAHRGQGEMYADRTLYYEEALGNVAQLSFSEAAHETLRRRLQGALDLCAAIGLDEWRQVRALGERCFRALSPDGRPLPMARFVEGVNAHLAALPELAPAPALVRLRDEVRRRAAGPGRTVEVPSACLALDPGAGARYALPDLFIAAESEQALTEGRFETFLGKVHHHLLLPSWLTTFVDDAAGLETELRAALDRPGLNQLVGLEVMRRNKGFYAFSGPRITYGDEPAASAGVPTLPMRDVTVAFEPDSGLVLRAPGRAAMHLYLTLADHLRHPPFAMLTCPWLAQVDVDLGLYTPRITVDGVVVQRARWHVDAAALRETARSTDPWASFAAVARWATALGMPQQVYVKGAERKPLFVDFAIPQCHALLLGLAENAPTLRVEEMYPGPDALWLNQARGGFTCELRAAVLRLPELPME